MTAPIYIDHSDADAPWAAELAVMLRSLGARVELRDEVHVGDSRMAALERAFHATTRFILVVTPESMADPQSQVTWQGHIQRSGITCVTLLLRRAPMPDLLRNYKSLAPDWDSPDSRRTGARQLAEAFDLSIPPDAPPELPPRADPVVPDAVWERLVRAFTPLGTVPVFANILLSDCRELGVDAKPFGCDGVGVLVANAYLVRVAAAPDGVQRLLAALVRHKEALTGVGNSSAQLDGLAGSLDGLVAARHGTDIRHAYLAALIRLLETEPLTLPQRGLGQRYILEVFVEPEADLAHGSRVPCELEDIVHGRTSNAGHSLDHWLNDPDKRRWSVLGEPGSGKTTLLKYTALTRAKYARDAREDAPSGAIPLLLRVTEFVAAAGDPFDAADAIASRNGFPAGTGGWLRAQAERGHVLMLLDGLDEVPSKQVEALQNAMDTLKNRHELFEAGCRLVLSSRFTGYDDRADAFEELRLLPLDGPAQQRLLDKCLPDHPDVVRALVDSIARERTLREVAGNPFLLTLMALIAATPTQGVRGLRPAHRRSEILKKAIDLLLYGAPRIRPRAKVDHPIHTHRDLVRPILARLALRLLERDAGPYDFATVSRLLIEDPTWSVLHARQKAWMSPETFLQDLAAHSELMLQADDVGDLWRFAHRSLQESLAAQALAQAGESTWGPRAREVGANEALLGQWAETFALLAGEVPDANTLLDRLMQHNPDLAYRALGSASGVVHPDTMRRLLKLELGGHSWQKRLGVMLELRDRLGLTKALVDLLDELRRGTTHGADLFFIRELLEAVARDGGDARTRAAAGQALRDLFQHISAPPVLTKERVVLPNGQDAPYWCEVSGLPGLLAIGRVPITNALYERFDPGHERAFADKLSADELAHHPVVNVTWYEAETFCRWLAQANPGLCLPSSVQWEFAATGGDGRVYPWPEKSLDRTRANYARNVGLTTAVGSYPKGAGPFGSLDQAGNVWEWIADRIHHTAGPIVDIVDNAAFALRGGSWDYPAELLAAAIRSRYLGWHRSRYFGFRCALSSSSPSTVR